MGRYKVIKSAEDFAAKVLDFIGVCESAEQSPTDYELWQFLGVSASEWDNLSKGLDRNGKAWPNRAKSEEERKRAEEADKREAGDAVKKLVAYREDRLVKRLEESRNVNGNTIFLLKQAKNGGYVDVQKDEVGGAVTVKIDGVGGLESFR